MQEEGAPRARGREVGLLLMTSIRGHALGGSVEPGVHWNLRSRDPVSRDLFYSILLSCAQNFADIFSSMLVTARARQRSQRSRSLTDDRLTVLSVHSHLNHGAVPCPRAACCVGIKL